MLVTYEDAVNVSRCLDYVCCRDIAVPLETPLGDDVDKVNPRHHDAFQRVLLTIDRLQW